MDKTEEQFISYIVGKKGKKPSTARTYWAKVVLFQKRIDVALDHVTSQMIVDYLADLSLKRRQNPNTRRQAKTALEMFYSFYAPLVGMANPTKGLQPIKKHISHPKMTHPEEIERMFKELDPLDTDWSRRACAIIAFLADTGVRIEEFENLKAGDISLVKSGANRHFQVIVPALKGTHSRVIPFGNFIDGTLAEIFAKYYLWVIVDQQQRPQAPFFYQLSSKHFKTETDMSKPLMRKGVQYLLNKASYLAGIDRGITPHQFRHFYATYAIINKMDIFTLREYMGHASISTTQQYIHIADTVTGNALKHSPTQNIHVPISSVGYVKLIRELSERL